MTLRRMAGGEFAQGSCDVLLEESLEINRGKVVAPAGTNLAGFGSGCSDRVIQGSGSAAG